MGHDAGGDLDGRVEAGLLGVHCGDSLGATFELGPPNRGEPLVDVVGGGPFGWDAGAATDDTDLTVAVAAAYADAADGRVQDAPESIAGRAAERMVDWLLGEPVDVGATTAEALARVARGAVPWRAGSEHDRSAANGGLMRCLPTALARPDADLRADESRLISSITHRERRCLDAVVVHNDVAAGLLDGLEPRRAVADALERLRAGAHDRSTVEAVAGALDAERMPWQDGGYVLTSLAIAVWAVCRPEPAEQVLVEVCNAGGDADTNGAIAGGLLGVRDGTDCWPQRWTDRLQRADELRGLAARLAVLRRGEPTGPQAGRG